MAIKLLKSIFPRMAQNKNYFSLSRHLCYAKKFNCRWCFYFLFKKWLDLLER